MRTRALRLITLLLCSFGLAATSAPAKKDPLRVRLPEVRMAAVALSDAIDFLRDVSGANLHVNWRALEEQGVSRETQISLQVRNISLAKSLDLLLQQAGAANPLAYYLDQNVIEITTQALADEVMVTRVYPIDDLLLDIPDFESNVNFSTFSNNDAAGTSAAGAAGTNSPTDADGGQTREERADAIVELIVQTIRPEIWRQNGGKASIVLFNNSLIVTAPRSIQKAIGG